MTTIQRSSAAGAVSALAVNEAVNAIAPEPLRAPNAPLAIAPVTVRPVSPAEQRLVTRLNALAFGRLQKLCEKRSDVSTMLSPPAALGLIAPLIYGANAVELARVKNALGMSDIPDDDFMNAVRTILARSQVKTTVWSRPDFVVDATFAERVHAALGTELESVPADNAKPRIDSWLFNATHGRIRDLTDRDLLVNSPIATSSSVAFDPLWATFFKPGDTVAQYPFIKKDGSTVAVRMMVGDLPCHSNATADYRAAKLDLDSGMSFICVVPAEEVEIGDLVRGIATPEGLQRFVDSLQPAKGTLYIPKIEIDARANGAGLLDDATRGPYSGIGNTTVSLVKGREGSTMRFSEPGVTIGGGAVASFWASKRPQRALSAAPEIIEANRPFLYLVRDDASGLIIGAGIFEGPEEGPLHLQPERKLDIAQSGLPHYIAAASGLVRVGKNYWVAADDENCLGIFPIAGGPGRTFDVFAGELPSDPKERKAQKPDLESILLLPRELTKAPNDIVLGIGSGSKPNRHRGVAVPVTPDGEPVGTVQHVDWSQLNNVLAAQFPKLNIEGACVVGDRIRLAQRGNGKKNVSAIVDLDLQAVVGAVLANQPIPASSVRNVLRIDLGVIDKTPWAVTDLAALPDGRMVFTAAAEASSDTVGDGSIKGTAVGIMDADGSVSLFLQTDPMIKLEGIAIDSISDGFAHVSLVTDADDATRPATMFKASLPLS